MVKHFDEGYYKQGFEYFGLKYIWTGYKTIAITSRLD